MLLISANPASPSHFTGRKATTGRKAKKGATVAKKHRSAAQKAATRKMLAANKARKTHRNPTARKATRRRKSAVHTVAARRRRTVRRNPGFLSGLTSGGVLGELISKEGLMMVAGAMAAPMVTDYLQEKIMPTATGWTKIALKAALVLGGAFAIDKFLKMRKAAIAYAVTGAAVVASDAIQIGRGVMAGLSASEADMVATRPDLVARIAQGTGYSRGLAGYGPSLAETGTQSDGAFNTPFSRAF